MKDSTQGTVLQTSINGMQDNNKTLASLAASDSRWQKLNDFESASWAAKAVNYRLTTCVDYKYVLENQDMSKFPYVSTFQASIGPIHMSRAVDGRGWLLKQCKTERKTVRVSIKLSNIKYFRDSSQSRSQFTTYKGVDFTARVFLSDKPKLNPPAKGKIYIKNVTMTAVNDTQAPRSSGFFWR